MFVSFGVCLMLIGRLGYLQFVEGPDLKTVSAKNYVRTIRIPAQRGTLTDRDGETLAVHRSTFDLFVIPSRIKDVPVLLDQLRKVLPLDELVWLELAERIKEPRGMWRHRPIQVHKDLDRNQVAKVESLRAQFSGIKISTRYRREYPLEEVSAHLLGYIGRPTAKEIQANSRYHIDSMLGRTGVESLLEKDLAGFDGYERFAVNARGSREAAAWTENAMSEIVRREEPTRGNDVQLTVDADIQKLLVRAMKSVHSGAAVMIDTNTGAILGMVSKPAFNPNSWSGRLSRKEKDGIDQNPYKPMLDKSVHAYFPGSVYKVVTAFAGMDLGLLDSEELIESPGAYEFGQRTFHCHKRSGHGRINLSRAMAASADVYFYKLGEIIGIDRLAVYGRKFGFGRRTGIRINGEAKGTVPTRAYHDEMTPGGFQHGLALSTAVGQGDVRTSPLQMAVAYAALANGGRVFKPYVVQRITKSDGTILSEASPELVDELGGAPELITAINTGLREAVHDDRFGTAHNAALDQGEIAGKTGTAQVRKIARGRNLQRVRHFRERDHAWFAAFAPFEEPQISLIVFLEHGGSGGKKAAPIARRILEAYHSRIQPLFAQKEKTGKKRQAP